MYVDFQGRNSSCEIVPYYDANRRLRPPSVKQCKLLATSSVKQGLVPVAPTRETSYSRFGICIALKLRLFPSFFDPGCKTRKIFLFIVLLPTSGPFFSPSISPRHFDKSTPCSKTFSQKFRRKDILPGGGFVGLFFFKRSFKAKVWQCKAKST